MRKFGISVIQRPNGIWWAYVGEALRIDTELTPPDGVGNNLHHAALRANVSVHSGRQEYIELPDEVLKEWADYKDYKRQMRLQSGKLP